MSLSRQYYKDLLTECALYLHKRNITFTDMSKVLRGNNSTLSKLVRAANKPKLSEHVDIVHNNLKDIE